MNKCTQRNRTRLFVTILLLLPFKVLFSQVSITGPTCVTAGVEYQYTISGNWNSSTYMEWCVDGGTLAGTTDRCKSGTPVVYIRVIWSSSSGRVHLYSSAGSADTYVSFAPALQAGAISANKVQKLPYYTVPATISAPVPTGGNCAPNYTYEWEFSKDKVNWTSIGGNQPQNYTFSSPAQQTSYYRRKVTETTSSTIGYSDIATVAIVTGTQSINEAESCTGILGPPVVAVNFGVGNNPGAALPAGATTYTYVTGGVQPGQYTIRNSTTSYASQFHAVATDHTPNDVNGYMMVLDGDDRSGEFYRTRVSGLISNIRYEFSAWVGNLDNSDGFEDPNITFNIYSTTGALLGTSKAKIIPYASPFQWVRISFVFDVPLNINTVNIVIFNNNRRTGGNDLLLDDIAFAPCYPPVLASFTSGVITSKKSVCNSGTVNLYGSWPAPIPFTSPGYRWQRSSGSSGDNWQDIVGATTINYTRTETVAGIYQYRLISYETADPSKFVISNPITFFVMKMQVNAQTFGFNSCDATAHQLTPSYSLMYADPAVSPLSYTFSWSPATYLSSTTIANPIISLPALAPNTNPGGPPPAPVNYNYVLTVTNTNFGCIGSGNITVSHYSPRKVYVPSGFTPNNDGSNDRFRPINLEDYPGSVFRVFNRWGQNVYTESRSDRRPYVGWDGIFNGTAQPGDNYVWEVLMSNCSGNIDPGMKGNVVLIR